MSGKIITCFNNEECIYTQCVMFSQELDTCKLELLKQTPNTSELPVGKQPQRQAALPATNNIRNLKVGDQKIEIGGRVDGDPIQRDVDTARGPATVTSIIVNDGTGKAKVSFWGDSGDKIMEFKSGDGIVISNIWRVKEFYDGVPQLDSGKFAKVSKA